MKVKKFPQLLYKISIGFFNSIAFYPLIISIILFITSILVVYLETTKVINTFSDDYSFLFADGYDNARGILTTLIAGIISLTVFSFSMVMIVLSQASSSFSPRVIPGVITKKSHQIVLGFYIGTIIYSLILIHNLTPKSAGGELPQFGIFIGEMLGIFCLTLFVYFIHSISKSIQIDHIITSIKEDTLKELKKISPEDKTETILSETNEWIILNSIQSGYYRSFEKKDVLKILEKEDLQLKILAKKGDFLLVDTPIARISKMPDEKKAEKLLGYFIFHEEEFISENYLYGFKQLSEVAVKALSPGINDPGTAITVIDQLTILFAERLNQPEYLHYDDNKKLRVIETNWKFEELLYRFFSPIRAYGKKDPLIIISLLGGMKNLIDHKNCSSENFDALKKEIDVILDDADSEIKNSMDRKMINQKVEEINRSFSGSIKTLN